MKLEWTQKFQESFERLKYLLCVALVLKIADLDKYFEVCIDAFLEVLGGVIMQERNMVAYESCNL